MRARPLAHRYHRSRLLVRALRWIRQSKICCRHRLSENIIESVETRTPTTAAGVLAIRDFRWLFVGTLLVSMTMPLQFLSQMFWVQTYLPEQETFISGLVAGSRGVSMLVFGLLGGALADRFERRRLLLSAQWTALLGNLGIALLMLFRPLAGATIWPILALTVVTSACWTVDNAARNASLPTIVGLPLVSRAVTLNTMATQVAHPIVLPLSGFLLDVFDPGQVYCLSLLAWVFILPLLHALHFRSEGQARRDLGILGNVREGLGYVLRHPALRVILLLLLSLQVLGMPGVGMLAPVWATRVLELSPRGFGFVAMTWGLGAASASFFYAVTSRSAGRVGVLLSNVALFGLATVIFGLSRSVALTAVANFFLGAGLVGAMVTASTLSQMLVSDEMRGRVMGLLPLTMGLAMLGAVPFGALGQRFGLELIVPTSGWLVLLAWMLTWFFARHTIAGVAERLGRR